MELSKNERHCKVISNEFKREMTAISTDMAILMNEWTDASFTIKYICKAFENRGSFTYIGITSHPHAATAANTRYGASSFVNAVYIYTKGDVRLVEERVQVSSKQLGWSWGGSG